MERLRKMAGDTSQAVIVLLVLALLLYGARLLVLAALPRSVRLSPAISYGSLGVVYLFFLAVVWQASRWNENLGAKIGLVRAGGKLALLVALAFGIVSLSVALLGRVRIAPAGLDAEWPSRLVWGLGVALVAPLVEEIIYRGLLFAFLLQWLPRFFPRLPWHPFYPALLLSALAFALAHLGSSPLFLAVLFVGGLVYGWVRWRGASIWPSFAGHAAWNGMLVAGQTVLWLT